jgi:hypothetical protein
MSRTTTDAAQRKAPGVEVSYAGLAVFRLMTSSNLVLAGQGRPRGTVSAEDLPAALVAVGGEDRARDAFLEVLANLIG